MLAERAGDMLHLTVMRSCVGWRSSLGWLALCGVLIAPSLSAQGRDDRALYLRPGDLLSVLVVGEKDLTGQFLVDDRGLVVLPLLGARPVTEAPWSQVRDSLLAEYARELRIPSIQITPLRRVTVLGQVNLAGMHMLDPHVTLAGAIAVAQGASPDGDLRRIRVVRDGVTLVDGAALEASMATLGIRSGDEIFVGRRGWWDRNSGMVVGAVISAVALLVTVSRP